MDFNKMLKQAQEMQEKVQEMKDKLESKNNSEEDIHETLQLNALQNQYCLYKIFY